VGRKLAGASLLEGLADGVALCDVATAAFDVSTFVHDSANVPRSGRRDNVQQFLDACRDAGVDDLFDLEDLVPDAGETSSEDVEASLVRCLAQVSKKSDAVPDMGSGELASYVRKDPFDAFKGDDCPFVFKPSVIESDSPFLDDEFDDDATAATVPTDRLGPHGGCLRPSIVLTDDDFTVRERDDDDSSLSDDDDGGDQKPCLIPWPHDRFDAVLDIVRDEQTKADARKLCVPGAKLSIEIKREYGPPSQSDVRATLTALPLTAKDRVTVIELRWDPTPEHNTLIADILREHDERPFQRRPVAVVADDDKKDPSSHAPTEDKMSPVVPSPEITTRG